jgi:hypothetical protein
MKLVIPAATVTTVSLITAGLLGVASAEAPRLPLRHPR